MQRDERGAALLEFAFVFGIFVFVLYALIAYGMMLSLKNSVTHAAAEGARAAIGVSSGDANHNGVDDREDAARARVATALNWLSTAQRNATTVTVTFLGPSSTPSCSTSCIEVHISYPYKTQPLVPPAPGLGIVTPDTLSSDAIVALS